jgi:hypothetical protein
VRPHERGAGEQLQAAGGVGSARAGGRERVLDHVIEAARVLDLDEEVEVTAPARGGCGSYSCGTLLIDSTCVACTLIQ